MTLCEVCGSPVRVVSSDEGTSHYEPMLDATTRMLRLAAIDSCIYIVQQSLDTVKAEDDGASASIRTSIAARAHVIALLTAYRDIEYAKEPQP